MTLLLVALGGGLGAAGRYVVDSVLPSGDADRVPRGTTAVNLSGSLLAGVLVGALAAGALDPRAYAVVLAGFCGGYTTFSTASLEAVRLLQRGRHWRAAGYALGSLLGTVAAAALGAWAAVVVVG
ncbi:fluoride efflux transporter CrcB [Georgenia phoenicis]|uniref:fluoride efflux transporter CrcB n=1 Tax=unclassified Georgenia TaxID=2626815 RepID=UPI0039B0BD22